MPFAPESAQLQKFSDRFADLTLRAYSSSRLDRRQPSGLSPHFSVLMFHVFAVSIRHHLTTSAQRGPKLHPSPIGRFAVIQRGAAIRRISLRCKTLRKDGRETN